MTTKMSFCVRAATTLHPYDLDAITSDIETMARAGLDMRDAERLSVDGALQRARDDRVQTARAIRSQHEDLFVPKRKALQTSKPASQYFTMPSEFEAPPRQARRIVRGSESINDPIVPETPDFVGNMTGDLAVMPALPGIASKPIRLPVGVAYGPHKGFGLAHIKDNADRYHRTPPNVTPDATENFARHAVSLIRSGLEVYRDANNDVILRDGRQKMAVVLEDRGGYYSVKTIRKALDPMIWGQMVARKRTSPPVSELLAPGKAVAYKFDTSGSDVRMAPVVARAAPQVTIKPRRQLEMPRQSRSTKAERQTSSPEFKKWFGSDNTMANPDGSPMTLFHGTTKANAQMRFFRRSSYGAMGSAVYLGDSEEASAGYDRGAMMRVYARGKYLTNMEWTGYVQKHGWEGAEAEATKDGWAGVYDEKFENAVAVWNPENIKSATDNTGAFSEGPWIRQSRTSLDEDLERQREWIGAEVARRGFSDLDDMVDKDFDSFIGLAEQWRDQNPADELRSRRAIEPAPMYASRPVENAEDIVAWAEEQGIRDILPADKMHVTVAYSKAPVDSNDLPPAGAAPVTGLNRSVKKLGGAVVLTIDSPAMATRWAAIKEAGASWDFEDSAPAYTPHITISYNGEGADVSDVEPYTGPVVLGDEVVEDLKSGWGADTLKQSRPAAGYSFPGFGNGSLFVEKIQDRYNRWKQVIAAVTKQGGIVNEANDFYKAEERYWGKVGSRIEDFDAEVQSFLDAMTKDKIDSRSMQLYAYAKHAKERNAYLRTLREANPNTGFDSWSGMSDDDADAILNDAHAAGLAPLFDKHHAELMKWTQGTRDLMLTDGLITQDQYDTLNNSYKAYVPLKGKPGGDSSKGAGTGTGFNIRGKETQRAKGRYSEAGDIIENIIADRVRALTRSGKNEVLRTFLKFVIDNPDPTQWQINATSMKPVMTVDANGNQVIEEQRQIMKGEDAVGIKDGGREVFVRIKDEKLVEQMRNMNAQEVGWLTGHLLTANRMLSRLYTSLSPVFTVLNFARDLTAGTIGMIGETGFSGAARLLANMPRALFHSAMAEAGVPSQEYQLFRATGGKTGFMDFKSIDDLAKDLSKRVTQIDQSNFDPRKFGAKALELIEGVNAAIENSTRLASFMSARQGGKTVAEAASISKNITVNFNRKGTLTPNLAAWFLFFNPAVQGTARVMQSLKSPATVATLGAGMTGIAMLALQNALAGDDDDGVAWWDKIPEEVKDRNIVIVLPPTSTQGEHIPGTRTGRYIKIPMPYGYNFFATVARLATDVWRNGHDKARGVTPVAAAKRAVGSFLGSYLPSQELARSIDSPKSLALLAVPDVLNAPVQSLLNVNSFGRPMYPENPQGTNTADAAKYFSAQAGTIFQRAAEGLNNATGGNTFKSGLLDFTPATLENLARSYGGGPVAFALDMLNMAYVRQSIERPTIDVRRSPFVKQLYGQIDEETDRQLSFERMDKISEAVDPIRAAMSAHKPGEAAQMRDAAGPIAYLGGQLKATRTQLSIIRKQELAIIASDKSDSEKFAKLSELSLRKRQSMQRLNAAYNAAMRRQPVEQEVELEQ